MPSSVEPSSTSPQGSPPSATSSWRPASRNDVRERTAEGIPLPRNAHHLLNLPASSSPSPSDSGFRSAKYGADRVEVQPPSYPKINVFEEDPHPHETNEIWVLGQGPVPALYVIFRHGVSVRYRFVGFRPEDVSPPTSDDFEIVPSSPGARLAQGGATRRLDVEELAGDAGQTTLTIEVHARGNDSLLLKIVGPQPTPPINYKPTGYQYTGPSKQT